MSAKKAEYREIICRQFCRFFKEGREELACATYDFLARNLTARELITAVRDKTFCADFSRDGEIKTLVCGKCDFLADGCDFRAGAGEFPCGGYVIVEWLLKNGLLK